MADENYNFETGEKPLFDMGFSTLTRINYELWSANQAEKKNDIDEWFNSLKVIYKEAEIYIPEKDKEKHIARMKEVEKYYDQFTSYNNMYRNLSKVRAVMYSPPKAIFDSLFKWDIELRRVLDKAGLLMKKGEDASSTMFRS